MMRGHQAAHEPNVSGTAYRSSPSCSPQERRFSNTLHETRGNPRQSFVLPPPSRSADDDDIGHTAPQRRRIAVACARCRRRKIKCTGDPGDGSGCHACRTSGTDVTTCVFHRVGSAIIPFQDAQDYLPRSRSSAMLPALSLETGHASSPFFDGAPRYRPLEHRSSLPILPTAVPIARDVAIYNPEIYRQSHSYLPTVTRESTPWVFHSAGQYSAMYESSVPQVESLQISPSHSDTHHPRIHYSQRQSSAGDDQSYQIPFHQERRLPVPFGPYVEPRQAPLSATTLRATQQSVSFRPLPIHDRAALPWTVGREQTAATSPTITEPAEQSARGEPVLGYQFTTTAAENSVQASDLISTARAPIPYRLSASASERSNTLELPHTQSELSLQTTQYFASDGTAAYDYGGLLVARDEQALNAVSLRRQTYGSFGYPTNFNGNQVHDPQPAQCHQQASYHTNDGVHHMIECPQPRGAARKRSSITSHVCL